MDRINLNLAVYDMDRTNTQIEFTLVAPDPITGNTRNTVETVNAPGTSKIRGVEFDVSDRLTQNLRASFAYAYTDTSVPPARNPFPASPNCPACGTVQPVYIIYTPEHAASLSRDTPGRSASRICACIWTATSTLEPRASSGPISAPRTR